MSADRRSARRAHPGRAAARARPGRGPRAARRGQRLGLQGRRRRSSAAPTGRWCSSGRCMYALLEAIDGERDLPALAAATSERLGPRARGRARRQDRREARRAGPARRHRGERAAALEPAARAALEGPVHRPEGDAGASPRRSSGCSARGSCSRRSSGSLAVLLVRADPRGRRARDRPGVRQARSCCCSSSASRSRRRPSTRSGTRPPAATAAAGPAAWAPASTSSGPPSTRT